MKINKNITPFNRWVGREGNEVEWIVLHYTANTYQPDLARNECQAFADRYIGSSAHFFVDETEVWQSVEIADTAWHCGDNPPPKNGCTNRNSIGIEMCVKYENGTYTIPDATVNLTADLVWYLLTMYPDAKICRHFDVTGKVCPGPWVEHPDQWIQFKKKIEEERPMTPAEKAEFDALKEQVKKLASAEKTDANNIKKLDKRVLDCENKVAVVDERTEVKYRTIKEVPEWGRPTIEKLVKKGYLKGDEKNLALTTELVRELVINDRAGVFD